MSSKQSSNSSANEPPFNDFDSSLNATHLIQNTPPHKQAKLLKIIEVAPNEQRRISLGEYTDSKPPKGFSVEVFPDPFPEGSLLTEVSSLGSSSRYKLVLHIANYGTKQLKVEVWEL